jgi:glycosyltransferase involved in cell wall biosynthesis
MSSGRLNGIEKRLGFGKCAAKDLGIIRKKMRILHVVPTYLPAVRYGGPIFAVHGLCRALVSRGHKVEVVTTNINGAKKSGVPVGVPVTLGGVQVRYFSSDFLRRLSWAPSLAQALRREIGGFDVVHLHTVFLWPTWAAARLARKARVPYLISPRGMLVKELIERRSRFAKSAWINLIEKSNLEHASAIHVTSELERADLMRFKWRLPQVATIPNGVEELEIAAKAEPSVDVTEIASHQPLVLFLGRISWKKGLDRLLNAFALTNAANLAIVGTNDEGLVAQLKQLAVKLQIQDRVRYLPRPVVGSDKEHLFAAARLLVLPSYSENFGNTVLEAMQRGVPVVVTPEVGAAAIVEEARGGMVVQGDPEPLGKVINFLINDPAFARSLGEAGRRYVQEHCAWPRIAAQMESLYGGLMRGRVACV